MLLIGNCGPQRSTDRLADHISSPIRVEGVPGELGPEDIARSSKKLDRVQCYSFHSTTAMRYLVN
jgi:hypothetical protein